MVFLPVEASAANDTAIRTSVQQLEPQCFVRMDAPHYSNGAQGIIAKARFICESRRSEVYEDIRMTIFTGCDDPLPDKKPFTRFDCDKITSRSISRIEVVSDQTVTRYVPKSSDDGHPKVDGYHRAYVKYEYSGSNTDFWRVSAQRSGKL